MSVYVGLAEGSKEISGIYLGSENSVKEISEGYISDADDNVKEIYSSVEPGQQVFTTSGTFTVPKGVKKVDVFLVGGGGMGGAPMRHTYYSGGVITSESVYGGAGGGGGYSTTAKGITVTPGEQYSIIVGNRSEKWEWNVGYTGGKSTALGYIANGGKNATYSSAAKGGDGGSGGGSGTYEYDNGTIINYTFAGNGGSDGSNGYRYSYTSTCDLLDGAKGQGTTTRAFGESSGTLYAGGGGAGYGLSNGYISKGGNGGGGNGAVSIGFDGIENSGGGGGGSCYNGSSYTLDQQLSGDTSGNITYRIGREGGNGGSGCVIIRWGY